MKTFIIVFYILSAGHNWQRVEFPYTTFSTLELCHSMIGMAHPGTRPTVIRCEEKR